MPTISLSDMQLDIEKSAAYFESLSRVLDGHALYLRAQNAVCRQEDLRLIEGQVGSLSVSVSYLKSAALRIAKVA